MLKRYHHIDDQMCNIEDLQEARNKASQPEISIEKVEKAIQANVGKKRKQASKSDGFKKSSKEKNRNST